MLLGKDNGNAGRRRWLSTNWLNPSEQPNEIDLSKFNQDLDVQVVWMTTLPTQNYVLHIWLTSCAPSLGKMTPSSELLRAKLRGGNNKLQL